MTLRQALSQERRKASERGGRVPTKTITELRRRFAPASAPAAFLTVQDKKAVVDPLLRTAFDAINHTSTIKRTRVPLLTWMGQASGMTQREVVAVFRKTLEIKPALSSQNLQFNLAIMRGVARMNLAPQYPTETRAMIDHWDETLCLYFSQLARDGLSLGDWWNNYQSLCGLVMDHQKALKIMVARGKFLPVAGELYELTRSSRLGNRMFGAAIAKLASEQVAAFCDEFIQDETGGVGWTDQRIHNVVSMVLERSQETPGCDLLVKPRVVDMQFLGFTVQVLVKSVEHEAKLRAAAFVKTLAWGHQLQMLDFERVYTVKCEHIHPMSNDLVGRFRGAREQLCEKLRQDSWQNAEQLKTIINGHAKVLLELDEAMALEIAYISAMVTDKGAAVAEDHLLGLLPASVADTKELKDVRADLASWIGSPFFPCISAQAQGAARMLQDCIQRMSGGFSPFEDVQSLSPFLVKVSQRLPNFVRFEVRVKDKVKVFAGRAALHNMVAHVKAQHASGQEITLKDVEPFVVYKWLLTPADNAEADKIIAQALSHAGVGCTGRGLETSAHASLAAPSAKRAKVAAASSSGAATPGEAGAGDSYFD